MLSCPPPPGWVSWQCLTGPLLPQGANRAPDRGGPESNRLELGQLTEGPVRGIAYKLQSGLGRIRYWSTPSFNFTYSSCQSFQRVPVLEVT